MLIGSLFSGCGGLDMAVQAVIPDTTPAWHSDTHPGAATILAHHWPHTPNLGDITTIDWGNVEPVDIHHRRITLPRHLHGRRPSRDDRRHPVQPVERDA